MTTASSSCRAARPPTVAAAAKRRGRTRKKAQAPCLRRAWPGHVRDARGTGEGGPYLCGQPGGLRSGASTRDFPFASQPLRSAVQSLNHFRHRPSRPCRASDRQAAGEPRFLSSIFGLTESGREADSVYLRAYDDYEFHTLKLTAGTTTGVAPYRLSRISPQALLRRVAAIEAHGCRHRLE